MSAISPAPTCPDCGAALPTDSPHALCPACLLRQALASRTLGADTGPAAASPPSPEEIADKFPQFEITECLGRGGMGVVYKARQKSLDRWVAIKILPPERVGEEKFAERFAREAQTLARLNHPNIVTVFDYGETGGLFYIVMEYVDGVNLRDLLREGKLEPKQALAIVPPICAALQYAHDKGIVHRDIKPENLLLDRDGRIKIADFGIAKLIEPAAVCDPRTSLDDDQRQSQNVATVQAGTHGYSAPEQANGAADHRSDIYALGVVLYEMLTGERPAKEVVAPSRKVQIDVRLDEMVLRALEKSPERRYQTAGEFQTVVETMAQTAPDKASASVDASDPGESRGGTLDEPSIQKRRRRKVVFHLPENATKKAAMRGMVAAAILLVILVLSAGIGMWKPSVGTAGIIAAVTALAPIKYVWIMVVGFVMTLATMLVTVTLVVRGTGSGPAKGLSIGCLVMVFGTVLAALTLVAVVVLANRMAPSQIRDPFAPHAAITPASPTTQTMGTKPHLEPIEPPWGTPDQGVAVRLRADKPRWTTAETPSLKADFRNLGTLDLATVQAQETATLEVDGVKYRWTGAFHLQNSPLPPGREYHDIPVTLGPEWVHTREQVESPPPPALKLMPGRHTLRFVPSIGAPGDTKSIRGPVIAAASNPVELEITAATGAADATAMAWGEPVNGVAVHLHADLTAWTADDFPVLTAIVRNRGDSAFPLSLGPAGNELEIDGEWFGWQPKMIPQESRLAPGAECAIPFTLLANSGQHQALRVRQHTLRFAVPVHAKGAAEAVRAISNPIKIDIVPGVRSRAALVARYLPGYQFRAERTGPGSLEEALVAPTGEKVNLAEIRADWRGIPAAPEVPPASPAEVGQPAYWYNAKLVAFLRPLHLKITAAAEAEEFTRLIMTILAGSGNLENREFHVKETPTGWHVAMPYVGPPAQIKALGPLDLILRDGVLDDIKQGASD